MDATLALNEELCIYVDSTGTLSASVYDSVALAPVVVDLTLSLGCKTY